MRPVGWQPAALLALLALCLSLPLAVQAGQEAGPPPGPPEARTEAGLRNNQAPEGSEDHPLPFTDTYLKLGVAAGTGPVPASVALGLQELGLSLELLGLQAPVVVSGERSTVSFVQVESRYRLPVGWAGWFPWVGAGLAHGRVASQAGGPAAVSLTATGPTAALGVERALAPASGWVILGELRYRAWPDLSAAGGGLSGGPWSAGVGLVYRWELPEQIRTAGIQDLERQRAMASGDWEPEGPSVSASGRVDAATVHGVRIRNGRWSASADLESGIGSFTIEATVNGRRERYTVRSDHVRLSGGRLVLSESFTAWSDGKRVRGTVTVQISRSSMRLSVSARRADGLSASATLRGRTTSFHVDR